MPGDGAEASVTTKVPGAVIWKEPICWVDASFVSVKAKVTVPPAGGPAGVGDTVTAKHLPADEAQEVFAPAAGAASIATPSTLVTAAARSPPAVLKTALPMTPTPVRVTR